MKCSTLQQNLNSLYSSVPKIVISRQDREPAKDILDLELLAEKITVYELHQNGDDRFELVVLKPMPTESELACIKLAPNFCLGLICFSDSGQQELQDLLTWWQERSSTQSMPLLVRFDSNQEQSKVQAEFWQQMYAVQAQETQALATRITILQKQYLGLRTLHENMQNAFATVEEYLSQAKLPPLQLAFAVQSSEHLLEPNQINGSNNLSIKQLLPVSSRGLASIELHVAQVDPQAKGFLRISLKVCEDNTAIAAWQIPYDHLSTGWLSLDLPDIDIGRKRDTELIAQWKTDLGPAPAFSLSKLQSIPEARVMIGDNDLKRSLSMKIWQGLPGTRKVTSPYLLRNSNGTKAIPDIQLGTLAQGIMAQVKEITPNKTTDDFPHVQVSGQGEKILTHPRADGSPTIAMLPFCFPPGANRLTATVAVEHEKAGIVAYGMAIIDPKQEPQNCLQQDAALAFSGWIEVLPLAPQQILVELSNSVEQHCHLVLAAKLTVGASPDFAWAYWLNFDLVASKSRSLVNQEIALPIIADPTSIRDASDCKEKSAFIKVQLIENNTKVQVHPTELGTSIAVLSKFIPSGTIRVEALVCTENEAASTIQYAMAAIAEDDDYMAQSVIRTPSLALCFSGWQSLPANQPGELVLDLVVPTVSDYHLVLSTRIPEGGSQNNAWARWIEIDHIINSQAYEDRNKIMQ